MINWKNLAPIMRFLVAAMISGSSSFVPSPSFLSLGMDFRVRVKFLENEMIEAMGCLFLHPIRLCLWSSLNPQSHLVSDHAGRGDGADFGFCDISPQVRLPKDSMLISGMFTAAWETGFVHSQKYEVSITRIYMPLGEDTETHGTVVEGHTT